MGILWIGNSFIWWSYGTEKVAWKGGLNKGGTNQYPIFRWVPLNRSLQQNKTSYVTLNYWFLVLSLYSTRSISKTHMYLHVNDSSIKSLPTVRNLGVIFNDTMTISQHVSTVCRSVNYHIRNIGKIRKYIDYDTCHAAARTLVLSRLDYFNSLLPIIRLQKLQNNAARLIHLKPKRYYLSPLLDELHWLPVHQRIVCKTALIMYKTVSNISPYYLYLSLDLSEPKREGLRSQHNLNIPRTFKKAGDQSFSVAGPRVWNSLPIQIRNSKSTDLFKKQLKTYLYPLEILFYYVIMLYCIFCILRLCMYVLFLRFVTLGKGTL